MDVESVDAKPDVGIDGGVDAGLPDIGLLAMLEVHAIAPTFGPRGGGTTVTVLGAGFVADQTSVQIGSSALTDVEVVNERMLRGVTSAFGADGELAVEVSIGAEAERLDGAFFAGGWEYA